MERRLTAILAADVVGYSRLMGADEAGTLAALKSSANGTHRWHGSPSISGRIVKLTGDGMLVEFSERGNAVACAAEIQRGCRNATQRCRLNSAASNSASASILAT